MMTPSEYNKAARRTEKTPEFIHVSDDIETNRLWSRIMHGILGKVTELGELADVAKKFLIYGKAPNVTNMVEEIGDDDWYTTLILDALDVGWEQAWERNIAKLRIRFPDKFTEHNALNRDLDAERAALEGPTHLDASKIDPDVVAALATNGESPRVNVSSVDPTDDRPPWRDRDGYVAQLKEQVTDQTRIISELREERESLIESNSWLHDKLAERNIALNRAHDAIDKYKDMEQELRKMKAAARQLQESMTHRARAEEAAKRHLADPSKAPTTSTGLGRDHEEYKSKPYAGKPDFSTHPMMRNAEEDVVRPGPESTVEYPEAKKTMVISPSFACKYYPFIHSFVNGICECGRREID